MFCQVKLFSNCKDIERVQRSLFLSDRYGENWLSECEVCLSPCGSLLVLSRGARLSILSSQWDSSAGCSTFVSSWSGTLPSDITSILIFPVSSRGQSSQTYSDWICLAVGFRTGEVGFYTEQGQVLLSERLDEAPVLRIKCHAGLHGSEADELYIVYPEAVCCIVASTLLQTLRFARTQLARGALVEPLADGQSMVSRKLGFSGQDVILDAAIVGLEISNTFDHLLTASTHGGFYTGYRSVAPHNTVVVGVGARPYLGFHQALEGGSAQPILHDVARAVASKIKSALPGWLGGGGGRVEVSPPLPSERMLCRYALCDLRRRGLLAASSPDRRLLAAADSLGRVSLLDTRRGIVVRMFKGYRDGQCGFLEVNEESHKRRGTGRKALFLVLYSGKRGHLEVWPPRGPRVATFAAAHHARLLYCAHTAFGHRTKAMSSPALTLMDPDGTIKHIIVPFHFALGNENSERARDVHLVRRLRQLIKEKECDYEQLKKEAINTTKELKTSDIKLHCVDMMAASRNVPPGILLTCVEFLRSVKQEVEEAVSSETEKLIILCDNISSLVRLFMYVNDIKIDESQDNDESSDNDFSVGETNNKKILTPEENSVNKVPENSLSEEKEQLSQEFSLISDEEMSNLQHLLNLAASVQQKRGVHQKVTFVDDKKARHSEFLSAFDLTSSDNLLRLKDSVTQETLHLIALQIYDPYIVGKSDWKSMWRKCYKRKGVLPAHMCKLLFTYWMALSVNEMTQARMDRFGEVLISICQSEGFHNVFVGYSDTSPWWQTVRDFLVDAPCPFRSMVSAQLCRAVAQKIEKGEEKKNSELEDGVWESVSKDNAQWGMLIGKLDDISLLSIVLTQKLEAINKLPKLQIEFPEINLKYIYNSGKGSISEITAKWLCSAGVDPKDIIENDKKNSSEENTIKEGLLSVKLDVESYDKAHKGTMMVFDKLNLLRKQFPLSLTSDSLIANMCWEYSKWWFKNIEDLNYLQATIYCLRNLLNVPMRCGICHLIWSTHMIFSFEGSYKLISKVGKLPREKLTRQNIGLSDTQLLKYLEYLTDFFDIFLCSALASTEETVVMLRFESIWEESSSALTELAIANSKINIDILQVHYQLCAAIYYQCYLGCNFWKHLSYLFDVDSQRCVFGSLKGDSGSVFRLQPTDSRVALQRVRFLSRLVHKCSDLAEGRDLWIDRVQDLARIWRVDGDHIRREHVSCLYAQGMDSLAEDALTSVTDPQPLVEVLVPIAGRRLKHFIDGTAERGDIISILPPLTTSYLQSLEEETNELTEITSLEPTRLMIQGILARAGMGAEGQLLKTAGMILDACTTLQEHLGIGM